MNVTAHRRYPAVFQPMLHARAFSKAANILQIQLELCAERSHAFHRCGRVTVRVRHENGIPVIIDQARNRFKQLGGMLGNDERKLQKENVRPL